MEEYHLTDGEVGTERSSDMPNVAKLGKETKDWWLARRYCRLMLYSGMCGTPEPHCHHADT